MSSKGPPVPSAPWGPPPCIAIRTWNSSGPWSTTLPKLLDYTTYDSPDMMFEIMGFGKRPDEPVQMSDPMLAGMVFRVPPMLLADGLGATIDEFLFDRKVAVAGAPFDIKAGRIEAGTRLPGQRHACRARDRTGMCCGPGDQDVPGPSDHRGPGSAGRLTSCARGAKVFWLAATAGRPSTT